MLEVICQLTTYNAANTHQDITIHLISFTAMSAI